MGSSQSRHFAPSSDISSASMFCWMALRVLRVTRTYCAETDLQWTGRNHPGGVDAQCLRHPCDLS